MTVSWDDQRKLESATRIGKEVSAQARDSWSPIVWGTVEAR